MAIAYINSIGSANQIAAQGTTVSTPSGINVSAGNLLIVVIHSGGENVVSSITDTAGNTFYNANSVGRFGVYYAKNVIANASDIITCTWAGAGNTYREISAFQYSGLDLGNPLDTNANGFSTTGTVTSGSFTTSLPNELLFCSLYVENTGKTWTAGSGYTLRSPSSDGVLAGQDQIVSSIQSGVTASATNTDTISAKEIIVNTFTSPRPSGALFFAQL